jgi:hypothetical protein
MKDNFGRQLLTGILFCLVLWAQPALAEVDAAQKINDAICVFIYLVEFSVGAIAAVVIVFMGMRYVSSGDDSDARYMARAGIIGAFVGILIVVLAVPFVNIVASGLIGTVECGFFPSISGGGVPLATGPVSQAKGGVSESSANSPDIAAKGFLLTKSLEEIKTGGYAEFPLYFQLANVGSQSSPGFVNTVSMLAGMDIVELCKVAATGLPADGKLLSYPCTGADMERVKQMLSGGKSVTLILKADSEGAVADSNRANNELSQDLSSVPVKKALSENDIGDMGGIAINYVTETP